MANNNHKFRQWSPFHQLGSTPLKRAAIILLLIVGTYLLIPRLAGLTETLELIPKANTVYLLAALASQIASVLWGAYIVHRMLPVFGPLLSFARVLHIVLASSFASLFIPSAGLSSLAVRTRYLGEDGCSVEATFLTFALETLGQGIAISILVTLALLQVALTGADAPWWIVALLASTVLVGIAALAILLSRPHEGDWRYRLLHWLNQRLARRGAALFSASSLEHRLAALRQGALALNTQRRWHLLLGSLSRVLTDMLCLQMTLYAFGRSVALSTTIVSYGLSSILGFLSSSPGGLFVTEGSLSAILAKRGVPFPVAVAVTLTYRLLAFWLPRLSGLVSWYVLQRQSSRPLW
nr:flippase-like domain-containing protein [Chloroflexota bacterium]